MPVELVAAAAETKASLLPAGADETPLAADFTTGPLGGRPPLFLFSLRSLLLDFACVACTGAPGDETTGEAGCFGDGGRPFRVHPRSRRLEWSGLAAPLATGETAFDAAAAVLLVWDFGPCAGTCFSPMADFAASLRTGDTALDAGAARLLAGDFGPRARPCRPLRAGLAAPLTSADTALDAGAAILLVGDFGP